MSISDDFQETIKRAKTNLDEAQRKYDAVKAIEAAFPAAKICDSHDSMYGVSHLAHEVVTHVDPAGIKAIYSARIPGDYGNSDIYLTFAPNVLYLVIQTPTGPVRVYSSRPVNLIAGFEEHFASGGRKPLIDCLRATTKQAEQAFAAYKQARDEAEAKSDETKTHASG